MSLSALLDRYGRAIVTVTVILAAAGLLTAFTLPSDIYPPLNFPRVVIIGHSGHAARALDDADRHPSDRAGA